MTSGFLGSQTLFYEAKGACWLTHESCNVSIAHEQWSLPTEPPLDDRGRADDSYSQALLAGWEAMQNKFNTLLGHYSKWILFSIIIGLLAGTAAAIFLTLLNLATNYRMLHPVLVWFLPVAGLLIGLSYHYFGKSAEGGTGLILEELHRPKKIIPLRMAPLVLLGTVLTHLFGGSAGREGTAVQMGASLADQLPTFFKMEVSERRILLVTGAGAGFSAAIGAPLAGALFGLEVMQIGRLQFFAIIECLVASFVAFGTCRFLGAPHTHYPSVVWGEYAESYGILQISSIAGAAVFFGLAANAFMRLTHIIEGLQKRFIHFMPLRPFVAGLLLVVFFQIGGAFRYEGLGLATITDSFSHAASWFDPVLKAGFTALTIGSGFKGGEFIPLVFIGSTLGSFMATLLPVSMSLLAALGFAAVFGAAANTPISCAVMAAELFGWRIAPFAFFACWIAYHFTGHNGIYKNQGIGRSKIDQLRLALQMPKFMKRRG